ncbi:MAG: hypothetical protein JKX99_04525 [Robiginitomaculum sp.]|nr:hypothetical protein [Robiginitomaculum sp.]
MGGLILLMGRFPRGDLQPCLKNRALHGFSVLEAMIAMAILAAALLPLLALQGQFVRSVDSMERVDARLAARTSAIHYVQALNLTQAPQGQFIQAQDTGPVLISWQATPALPARTVRGNGGFPGRFELTLYDVQITIAPAQGPTEQFSVRAVGWRPMRSILSDF